MDRPTIHCYRSYSHGQDDPCWGYTFRFNGRVHGAVGFESESVAMETAAAALAELEALCRTT